MSNFSSKVVKLLKIVAHPATGKSEALNARLGACKICAEHGLDYDALLAQAAQELRTENPEQDLRAAAQAAANAARESQTWAQAPHSAYTAETKYDPHSAQSREMLAGAIRDVLLLAGFAFASETTGFAPGQGEEIWTREVGFAHGRPIVVSVFTSIVGGKHAGGKRVGGAVRPLGSDQIRICAPGVSSRTRDGRKGHTVKRVGRLGTWTEGRDHHHCNNPGLLGRIYRELLNVTDEALRAHDGQAAPDPERAETAFDKLNRLMRDIRADIARVPHPSKIHANNGKTMVDYVLWVLADQRNHFDAKGNDRVKFAVEKIEAALG